MPRQIMLCCSMVWYGVHLRLRCGLPHVQCGIQKEDALSVRRWQSLRIAG